MDVVRTSRGFAVVGDDGRVVSVHRDRDEALDAMVRTEYVLAGQGVISHVDAERAQAFQGPRGPQASLSGPTMPPPTAPPGYVPPTQGPAGPPLARPPAPQPGIDQMTTSWPGGPATQGALERSRQAPQNILPEQPDQPMTVPVTVMSGPTSPPSFRTHKVGDTYQVLRDGEEVGRFKDEDAAIEHMNLHRYAHMRGIDLKSSVKPEDEPMPKMSGEWGWIGEMSKKTKQLEDPYYKKEEED